MAVVVQDSFTDTNGVLLENHTPDVGGTWVKASGSSLLIESNGLTHPEAYGTYYNDTDDVLNGYVKCKVTQLDADPDNTYGRIYLRRSSATVFYALELSATYIYVYKNAAYILAIEHTFVTGASYKLEISGTTLNVYKDAVLLGTIEDGTPLPAGKFGLMVWEESLVTDTIFDDFEGGSEEGAASTGFVSWA